MPEHTLASPPTDEDKYSYLKGKQHRWFFWAHLLSFCGIAYSLYGFARMEYWTLVFLLPLLFYAGETLLGLRTSTFRRRISLTDHLARVELFQPDTYPSIDVFLPSAGEALDLIENTYRHVSRLEYPGRLSIYVLDDFANPQIEALADEYSFFYFARPGSEYKKAGNLRYAYDRSDGEWIFILDADFVPRPDALTELTPYTFDPSVGIIQTPQIFHTPRKGMGWLERTAGATQELFYRFIQPSRDAHDASICVGTSALYRRRALEAIGGFPKISHSEDVFTGFEMANKQYRTTYVAINVTQGVCPGDIDSFITQQYRWCEGSMELLKNPLFHTGWPYTLSQRLSFWAGFFYYFTTSINVFLAPIPVLIMIWIFPQFVSPWNFIPLIGLPLLWLVGYPLLMRCRWRLEVLRVQAIYGFTHACSIFDVFFGKPAAWVPTGGEHVPTPLAVRVKRIMAWYISLTVTATVAGVTFRLLQPEHRLAEWWALLAFLAVNFYVFLPVAWESVRTLRSDRRDRKRPRTPAPADIPAPRKPVRVARPVMTMLSAPTAQEAE